VCKLLVSATTHKTYQHPPTSHIQGIETGAKREVKNDRKTAKYFKERGEKPVLRNSKCHRKKTNLKSKVATKKPSKTERKKAIRPKTKNQKEPPQKPKNPKISSKNFKEKSWQN
jgi:phosphate starvation-inducible protein PhoH